MIRSFLILFALLLLSDRIVAQEEIEQVFVGYKSSEQYVELVGIPKLSCIGSKNCLSNVVGGNGPAYAHEEITLP